MEKLILEALPDFLKQYGALGFAIVVLMGAVWLLWNALEKRNKEVAEIAKASTAAMTETATVLKALQIAIGVQSEDNKDRMQTLTVLATQAAETIRRLDSLSTEVRGLWQARQ